jgi:outer membrane protein OmpA-like peptidoglycan-associated protein
VKRKNIIAVALATILMSGCALVQPNLVKDDSYHRTKEGAVIGAVAGAVIGAVKTKKHLKGALVGAAAGAAVGGGVGYILDEQANAVAEALGTGVDNDPLALADPSRSIVVLKGDKYVRIMFRDAMMFPYNSDQLTPSARDKVARLAKVLRMYPNTIVQVAGFTDDRGSYEYNYKLSLRRAQSVAKILKAYGANNPIYIKGCSYNKPLVPNKTEAQRALNRRVEVYLYNNPADAVDPCTN